MGTVFPMEDFAVSCFHKIKEVVVSAYKAKAEMEWVWGKRSALK